MRLLDDTAVLELDNAIDIFQVSQERRTGTSTQTHNMGISAELALDIFVLRPRIPLPYGTAPQIR